MLPTSVARLSEALIIDVKWVGAKTWSLAWSNNQPTAKCWRHPYRTQTREYLFKNCPHWKAQQKTLWVEVRREKERGKDRFKIRTSSPMNDAARRSWTSSPSLIDGRLGPKPAEEDAQSKASEWELQEQN